ncbi:MAG TPA: mechanosensitive ion channel family protein [Burkholderiaceae bacterium]|nr:mechanosensitive ion channel family protein [Burkholderiaceae bacterium]
MDHLGDVARDALNRNSFVGAALLGALIFGLASVVVVLIRRTARRVGQHLSDVTALRFVSSLAQLLTYLIAFALCAHLVPELRVFGTALLAGASVFSVVVGLAAKDALGCLIAGFLLVLYRQVRVGDTIRVDSPAGVVTATVQVISLGFTILVDDQKAEVVVPNNVMMGSTIIRVARGPER